MKKKLMTIIALLGMFLTVAVGAASAQANTAADTVTFKLHKKHFTTIQSPKTNTGLEDENFGGKPLKDITFNVYNVSAKYHELVTGTTTTTAKTPQEAIAYLADATRFTTLPAPAMPAQTTDETGLATFAGLPEKTDGKYSVYMFVETMKPNFATTGNSARLVVTLPVYATVKDGEKDVETELKEIHLYPKNLVNRYSVELKKVGTDTDSAINGAKFTLQGTGGYYSSFDADSQEIVWSTTPVKFDGNTTFTGLVPGDYTLREVTKATGYELTDNAMETEFTVAADGTVAEPSVEDDNAKGIPLNVVNLNHTATANQIVVENRKLTNFTFAKKDAATGKALAGAVFNVAKEIPTGTEAPVLLYKDLTADAAKGQYGYVWSSELTAAQIADTEKFELVTMDGVGEANNLDAGDTLSGILAGTYYLYEKNAPDGFVQPTGADAYTKVDTFTGTGNAKVVTAPDGIVVNNTRKGALPSTGGNGIAMFVIIGGIVMAGALIVYRRTRTSQEQV